MTAPNIESSTREERLDYVLNEWKCLHNCEQMEQREQKPNLFGLCRNIVQTRAESSLLGCAECIHHLSDIVGDISASDTLQNIFRHFCIGK